jgi:hypothetical protein
MQSGLGAGSVGETSGRSESKNVGRSWGARAQKRSAMDDSSLYSSSPPLPNITVSSSSISKSTTPAKKKALSVSNDCSVDDELEGIGDDIIEDIGSE